MTNLVLFGNPVLERNGVALTGRPVQRHRLALLALLAMAPGGRLSRDKLIGFLWPERDTASGRNLLKVGTHVLRSDLGETVLISENDQLRLNDGVIRTDAAEFSAAVARLDYERAVTLYRGPFMDGFFLDDASEFEEWVTRERNRLATGYGSTLEKLATAAAAESDQVRAAAWWQKRAVHEPLDTRVALRLMEALEAGGSVARALQHAAIHEQLVRDEFGIDGPPELTAAVDRLRLKRTSPAAVDPAPAHPVDAPATSDPPIKEPAVAASTSAPAQPAQSRRHLWWRRALVPAALVLLAAAVFRIRSSSVPVREPSIVVLPFVDLSPQADKAHFSDGLTEEIIARLPSSHPAHSIGPDLSDPDISEDQC